MPIARSTRRPLALVLFAMLLCIPVAERAAHAQSTAEPPVRVGDDPAAVRKAKHDLIFREARAEARERAKRVAEARRLLKLKARGKKGARVQPALPEDRDSAGQPPVRLALPSGVSSVNAIPTNVLVNNKTGDAINDTQSEEGIAMVGNLGLCAWNDGHNFSSTVDAQQAAYTTNGGVSWTDVNAPPKPAGGRWASDPVVTVNEKTGTFYYAGLIDFPLAATNGIAMISATFPGGVFTWGTPHIVRNGPNTAIAFDKEWMAADSSTGNLYVAYTTFGAAGDSIIFQRSTNGGVSWGNPITVNSDPLSFGYVQGSRPALGPGGEVYVTWSEVGPSFDYMKLRKSTDAGVSLATEVIAGTEYSNFGTGAPGFNRDHGITFPSIAVDRTNGPHRGRVYMAWNETVNWYDDGLGGGGTVSEVESNNTPATATPFTPGQKLSGSLSSSADLDYWSFTATQGTNYIFWANSLPASTSFRYTMRMYCTDGVTRLAYSGDASSAASGLSPQPGFIVWTAPATGTYYFRMAGISGSGSYTVVTGIDAPSSGDRARDMRDAMVAWSDGGSVWSTQVRANDEAALYDDYFPEVTVSCEGYPYLSWYDFRDSPAANCGGIANVYTSRSTDGGATWVANQRFTSVSTNFTTALSNLQPNMGDYLGMSGGANVAYAWADGRLGDVDVWESTLTAAPSVGCPPGQTVNGGATFPLSFSLQNLNVVFDNTYSTTLTSDQPGWTITPPSQNLTLAASAGGNLGYTVTVPASSPSVIANLCLQVSAQGGGLCASCCVPVTVNSVLGVPPGGGARLALAGASPNPATASTGLSISFSLPGGSAATLELLDLSGRRVLAREVGSLGAGNHVVTWRRESSGLAAGIYVVRLSQGGRALTSKVVFTR